MNVLSLFSGIGGIDLGLQRAGMTIVGQCEVEPFALAVLEKHWPHVWRHTDVRTLTVDLVRKHCPRIDIIAGGFPCQDISAAGKGAGLGGERSGLWYEMLRIITGLAPAGVLIENVPALRTRGADEIIDGLEGIDYAAWPFVVGAEHVGLPHKRHRVWILAYAQRCIGGRERRTRDKELFADRKKTGRKKDDGGPENGRSNELANTGGTGCEERDIAALATESGFGAGCVDAARLWPSRPGQPQHAWEAPRLVEFPVGGAVDGVSGRLVRSANKHALKAFGNAVVPQVVEEIGRVILTLNGAPQ